MKEVENDSETLDANQKWEVVMTINEFINHEKASRDTIDVKKIYIDMAGDLVSGVLLSQIVYWHLPGPGGESRLRVQKDGHFWLAKKRSEWWNECRVSPKQFDRAIGVLEDRQCVKTEVFKFDGSPTKHVRLNWESFLPLYEALLNDDKGLVKWQGGKWKLPFGEYGNYPLGNMEITERGISLTEITTETTTEIPLFENSLFAENNHDTIESYPNTETEAVSLSGKTDETVLDSGEQSGDSSEPKQPPDNQEGESETEKLLQVTDEARLAYVQVVTKHYQDLIKILNKERPSEKHHKKVLCPRVMKTLEAGTEKKYRTILKWFEADIPVDYACAQLTKWMQQINLDLSIQIGGSLNFFDPKYPKWEMCYKTPEQQREFDKHRAQINAEIERREEAGDL